MVNLNARTGDMDGYEGQPGREKMEVRSIG